MLRVGRPLALVAVLLPAPFLFAQTCTTQAKLAMGVRNALADAALGLATAVQANDPNKVQGQTIREFAVNFAPTANLVRNTSGQLQGDVLRVTQVYELDAANRRECDSSAAEFTCALS